MVLAQPAHVKRLFIIVVMPLYTPRAILPSTLTNALCDVPPMDSPLKRAASADLQPLLIGPTLPPLTVALTEMPTHLHRVTPLDPLSTLLWRKVRPPFTHVCGVLAL